MDYKDYANNGLMKSLMQEREWLHEKLKHKQNADYQTQADLNQLQHKLEDLKELLVMREDEHALKIRDLEERLGEYMAADTEQRLANQICPLCETNHKLSEDYLCERCRFGN